MPDLPIDPKYLAPIATSTGVIVSIYLWLLNQRKKRLSYQVLANHPLVNYTEETRHRLDVRFDGERVPEAFLAVIKIENNGHLPIETKDYEARLAVNTAAGSRILMAQVVETNPADLSERIRDSSGIVPIIERVEETKITLRPVMLNSGDSITVQLLMSHAAAKLGITGHIHGISSIKEIRQSNLLENVTSCVGAFLMVSAMVFVPPDSLVHVIPDEFLPYVFTFLIGAVLLYTGRHMSSIRKIRSDRIYRLRPE